MALSDACSNFLQATAEAAEVLAEVVHHYSSPDYPIPYGTEIDALRRACLAVRERPYDPEAAAGLFRLATTVMAFHDTPPDTPESAHRETEMKRLVRLLEEPLDNPDRAAVPAVVRNVLVETRFTPLAAERFKAMLSGLSKPAYDVAIKIISDIGSATIKKMLGL
jgi:hypothetical protein